MQVRLEKTFPLDAPASAAWKLLQDIPGATGCIPGAEVTEQLDEIHYKGRMKFRLGPVSAVFAGSVEVKEVDAEGQRIHILGKGSDSTGTSAASMELTACIRPRAEGKCEIVGVSDITVSGKMVAFGGRMMQQVADELLKQFGSNFAARLAAETRPAEAGTEAPRPKEANALALIWNVILGFFRALFARGKTG